MPDKHDKHAGFQTQTFLHFIDDADSASSGEGSEDEDGDEDDDSSASSSSEGEEEEENQYVDDITLANELLQQEMDKFDAEEKQRQEYIQKLFGDGTASRVAGIAGGAAASSSSASSSSKIFIGGGPAAAPGTTSLEAVDTTTSLNTAGVLDPFFSQLEPMYDSAQLPLLPLICHSKFQIYRLPVSTLCMTDSESQNSTTIT